MSAQKVFFILAPILAFSSCASLTHESEAPEVLKAKELAIGGTIGSAASPFRNSQNFPASSTIMQVPVFLPSGRFGVGKNLEVTSDVGFCINSASSLPWSYSYDLRARYQWLDTETGFLSTASAGFFQEQETDQGTGDLSSAQENDPGNHVVHYFYFQRGFSLSDSIGRRLSKWATVYAGPRIYWVDFSGIYTHNLTGGETLSYRGPLYGMFVGSLMRVARLNLDAKISLTRMPINLRGTMRWAPSYSLSVQFTNFD